MASVKSLTLTIVVAIPLATATTAPPAKAGDAASVLLGIVAGVLVGTTSSAPPPQPAPQPQQPQQSMRWIDQVCLPNPNTTVCRSPVLRSMVQHNSELFAAYLSRLSGPAADQARAELRQRTAQYHGECGAAPVDQNCIYKWEYYWDQLYSARLAALSTPSAVQVQTSYATGCLIGCTPKQKSDIAKQVEIPLPRTAATPPPSRPRPAPATAPVTALPITGEITRATVAWFDAMMQQHPSITTVVLDSPGGNVDAGISLARRILDRRMRTIVPGGSECSSICFLMFAAGHPRIAGETARIGVHSPSLDGEETSATLAASTMLARMCGTLGVPDGILGKMIMKPGGGDVSWLSAAELHSMQVDIQ